MPIARLTDFQKPYMADAELEVHAEPDIYLSPMLLAKGVWEPLESQLVLGLAERSAVCVDVGANIGYYTVLCGRAMGERGRAFASGVFDTRVMVAKLLDVYAGIESS